MLIGFVLATALALLSIARVDIHGKPYLAYRTQELWTSQSTLLVTQKQFPEGRSVFQQTIPAASTKSQTFAPQFADPNRFTALTNLYAQLATSDPVRQLMIKRWGRPKGIVQAVPAETANGSATLPLLTIAAIAPSPRAAVTLANHAKQAFTDYLQMNQSRSQIPTEQRVLLEVINEPRTAKLLKGHSKTLPAVVFLTILFGVFGLALGLENLRPRPEGFVVVESASAVGDGHTQPPVAERSVSAAGRRSA
jgi:hypothetical protein